MYAQDNNSNQIEESNKNVNFIKIAVSNKVLQY